MLDDVQIGYVELTSGARSFVSLRLAVTRLVAHAPTKGCFMLNKRSLDIFDYCISALFII